MANSTLLQLVNRAEAEMGIAVSSSVIGNTALATIQRLNLINSIGQDLVKEYDWQQLDIEYRFPTVYYQYTATTTSDSTTISAMSSTTGLTSTPTYFMVTGTGINQDTYLVSVNAGNSTAVLTQAASASGTVTLTFAQTKYAMPSDYERLVDRTQWDQTQHWEMLGPETGQQWQWLKSGYIATGPRIRFRVLGGLFQIWPPQAIADRLGFEYISNLWVLVTAGTAPTKTSFTVDTDTCIFPDRLMIESLKLRYRAALNMKSAAMSYSKNDLLRGYPLTLLDLAKSEDSSHQTLSFAPKLTPQLIGWYNIPDSGFGS